MSTSSAADLESVVKRGKGEITVNRKKMLQYDSRTAGNPEAYVGCRKGGDVPCSGWVRSPFSASFHRACRSDPVPCMLHGWTTHTGRVLLWGPSGGM